MRDVLRIICPNLKCRTILSVPQTARGKSVRCKVCGNRFAVPLKSEPNPDDAFTTIRSVPNF